MDPKSLTVSFLRNSCGFSLKLAVSASKKLKIENIENPNSVLDLLRTHGLEHNHIRYLISSRPLLLSADLANTLKPNMELFKSLGFCGASLAKMLSKYPTVLESDAYTVVEFFRARGKQVIPCVQELRRILRTDENVLKVMKAYDAIIRTNIVHMLQPNIANLISHGVPQSSVLKLFFRKPFPLCICSNRFSEIVSDIMNLGFEPNCRQFVLAIGSMALNTKTSWGQKVEAFRSSGMSEDEIYAAFKRQPLCMSCSEKKIKKMMGFFVNKLKMKPSRISKTPILIQFSFEKRIIPRCSVLF
ncbi:hypothetical protein I3842_12G034400 [Carya illinoinensis]|uniref:Uncharacterized protein n=1 Tax=Carya illinoinensis TaxID=32201 RepID=A0A922DGA6_CARIL|nr:hypothetical protein I3842_12G034400 [Carya illinoinensis]